MCGVRCYSAQLCKAITLFIINAPVNVKLGGGGEDKFGHRYCGCVGSDVISTQPNKAITLLIVPLPPEGQGREYSFCQCHMFVCLFVCLFVCSDFHHRKLSNLHTHYTTLL